MDVIHEESAEHDTDTHIVEKPYDVRHLRIAANYHKHTHKKPDDQMSYSMHIDAEQYRLMDQIRLTKTPKKTEECVNVGTISPLSKDDSESDSSSDFDIGQIAEPVDNKDNIFNLNDINTYDNEDKEEVDDENIEDLSKSNMEEKVLYSYEKPDDNKVETKIEKISSSSNMQQSSIGGFFSGIISASASTIASVMSVESMYDPRVYDPKTGTILKKENKEVKSSLKKHNDLNEDADKLRRLNIESRRASKWVEDSSVAKCFKCDTDFTMILRKHHCRLCGRVFCSQCSNYFTKLPLDILNKIPNKPQTFVDLIIGEDLNGIVRTCNDCFSQASKLIRIRKIIKVFELCQFTIKDLNLLAKLSVDWEDAAKFILSKFREIQYKLSIEPLTSSEKQLLWINRNFLTGHSRWMVQLVKATNLDNEKSLLILEQLMYKKRINKCWDIMCSRFCSEIIGITDILDLIRYNRNFSVISNFIVKFIIDTYITIIKYYLPFLVFNIQYNKFILDILLDKGIDDFKFISNLYWCIKSFCPDPDLRKEYIVMILVTIKDKASKEFRRRFKEMIEMESIELKTLHELNEKKRIILPICADMTFKHIDIHNVKIMNSVSQPAIITFIDEKGKRKPIRFKNDDVRKDYIVLNIIDIIHNILKTEEDLDIEMVNYEVVPTFHNGENAGYIEIVEDAATIFNIVEHSGLTIQNFILNNNKDLKIGEFRKKFIESTALYCVVSYLLGIGDRHLDNIMISKNGLLFHIDF